MIKLWLLLFCLISGCSSKPYAIEVQETTSVLGKHQVYVVSHGWHTGFVVPAADIQAKVPQLKHRFANTGYIEFGWGDKGFYQSKEITSGLTVRAIFWPTESVIHAVAIPDKVMRYFSGSDIRLLCLGPAEYASLIQFISNSFARNKAGDIFATKSGIYGNSQFYTGVGDYYLMNTCNKWTAKGLKSAGLNISPAFKLTADSIISYMDDLPSPRVNSCAGF